MRLSGKLVLAALVSAVAVVGTAAESLAEGNVSLSKPLIKGDGTAKLPVTFSQPGKVVLWDARTLQPCGGPPRIQRVELTTDKPETVRLPVRPTHLIKPTLKEGRAGKVLVEVDYYAPGTDTNPEVHVRQLSLRISAKNASAAAATPLCGSTPTQPYGSGGGFTLGHPTRNPDGTATVPAHFSRRGKVRIFDNQEGRPCGGPPLIEDHSQKVKPGDVDLHVHPNKDFLQELRDGIATTTKVAFSFTPAGGKETIKRIPVTFQRSARAAAAAGSAVPRC